MLRMVVWYRGFYEGAERKLRTHSINRRDHRMCRVLARTLATSSVIITVNYLIRSCGLFFLSMISHPFDKTTNPNTCALPVILGTNLFVFLQTDKSHGIIVSYCHIAVGNISGQPSTRPWTSSTLTLADLLSLLSPSIHFSSNINLASSWRIQTKSVCHHLLWWSKLVLVVLRPALKENQQYNHLHQNSLSIISLIQYFLRLNLLFTLFLRSLSANFPRKPQPQTWQSP